MSDGKHFTEKLFQRDNLGRRVYFPFGALGSGYLVETEEKYGEIQNLLTYAGLGGILITALAGFVLESLFVIFVLLVANLPWMWVWSHHAARGLSKSELKFDRTILRQSGQEGLAHLTKSTNWAYLIILEIFCLILVVSGVQFMGREDSAILMVLFGMCGTVVFAWQIILKFKSGR